MPIPINYENKTSTNITRLKCLQILPVASLLLFAFFSQSMDANANGLYMPLQQSTSGTHDTHRKETSKYLGYGGDVIHLVASKSKSFDRLTVHTASLNPQFCIQYDSILKSITVTCKFANLSQVDKVLKNPSALSRDGDGIWLLNADLNIDDGANFVIDSNDTKWLKINSTAADPHHIYVKGNLRIDSVKVSSWNTTSNDYAMTDVNTPRASITVQPKGTGKTDIFNSEIAYLGDGNTSRGQGLSYWSADGSIIKNNTIHHMYYGFYSEGVGNITIENNRVHSDIKYGLDPHTKTHDMTIRNNTVHGNGHIGIICSLDCSNITIEGNTVYNNTKAGIMFSKNVQNSVVRDNKIQGEDTGISVSESSKDLVHGNVINNSANGIQVKLNSTNNKVQNNYIYHSDKCGIQISDAASRNFISSNTVLNSTKSGICLLDGPVANTINNNTIDASNSFAIYARDSNSTDNIVRENLLLNVTKSPIKMVNSTLTVLNNTSPTH